MFSGAPTRISDATSADAERPAAAQVSSAGGTQDLYPRNLQTTQQRNHVRHHFDE
nr:hypothetical protein [Arthrobacter sp. Rue61a]